MLLGEIFLERTSLFALWDIIQLYENKIKIECEILDEYVSDSDENSEGYYCVIGHNIGN